MTIHVLFNRDSGTIRDKGPVELAQAIRDVFDKAEQDATVEPLHPRDLRNRLRELRDANSPPEAIVIGGGDGSVSTGARELLHTGIALGVLPLGTFNLFARAIGMPLDPVKAAEALVEAKPAKVDTMDVNGCTVLQHASIGLQPRVILLREEMSHSSRVEKLANGLRAWIKVIRRPPLLELKTVSDGDVATRITPAVLITNNILREGLGEPLVSAHLKQSRIAVYVCTATRRADLVKFSLAASLGLWRETGLIEEMVAREVTISGRHRRLLMSIDGELESFDMPLVCRSQPGSLTVLMPLAAEGAAGAEKVTDG